MKSDLKHFQEQSGLDRITTTLKKEEREEQRREDGRGREEGELMPMMDAVNLFLHNTRSLHL